MKKFLAIVLIGAALVGGTAVASASSEPVCPDGNICHN